MFGLFSIVVGCFFMGLFWFFGFFVVFFLFLFIKVVLFI